MAVGERKPSQDRDPGTGGQRKLPHEPDSKPVMPGAYVGKHLIFGTPGKAVGGQAIVANRTREIRPSGMKGGA